jgi:hypothetical protein
MRSTRQFLCARGDRDFPCLLTLARPFGRTTGAHSSYYSLSRQYVHWCPVRIRSNLVDHHGINPRIHHAIPAVQFYSGAGRLHEYRPLHRQSHWRALRWLLLRSSYSVLFSPQQRLVRAGDAVVLASSSRLGYGWRACYVRCQHVQGKFLRLKDCVAICLHGDRANHGASYPSAVLCSVSASVALGTPR